MDLRDTPDDSLRHAAERGLAEALARAKSDYEAAERALADADARAVAAFGAAAVLHNPPEYVRAAWAHRDACWNAWLAVEGVAEELAEMAGGAQ